MLATGLATFVIIFLAELPDKTALAALALATRMSIRDVILGGWAAFLVQTIIAVAGGSLISQLPERPIRVAAGVGFLVFAVLALRRDEEAEMAEERRDVQATRRQRPGWITAFLVIFAAEFGDLTQLATAALVAQSRQPVAVFFGALPALMLVTVIAAAVGNRVGRYLSGAVIQKVSAGLFAIVGIVVLVTALR